MRRIRCRRRHPVAHAAGLVDALLQDLAVLRLLVEHQLLGILRRVELALLVPDAELAEHAFHAERPRFVRHDRHDVLAEVLVADERVQDLHECHRRRDLAVFGALEKAFKGSELRYRERRCLRTSRRQIAAELHPPRPHVLELGRSFGERHVRDLVELVVLDRDVKAVAERADRDPGHLLLLVRDVLRLARFAHAVALDRLREDHRRLALVVDRGLIRVVDLERIVAAAVELPDVVVRIVGDKLLQLRRVEEMLAHVRAVLRFDRLVLAVDDFHHSLRQDALLVAREQRIPVAAPDHLDHVPARAAEVALELLDDLAVAAHRTIEPLQVAVDDEDQVIEVLARRHADRAHRLGLVHLAVAAEAPDLASFGLREAAVLQVLHEARLVDRHQRPEAHRHRRELPDVGHQPRVRVRRNPFAVDFLPEVVHLFGREPAEHEHPCIDPRRGVALDQHEIAAVLPRRRVPEMVVADVVEHRRGRKARDVAADVRVLVRANDHCHRVPPHVVADLLLEVEVSREPNLLLHGNCVDVRGVRRERQIGARASRFVDQRLDQELRALRSLVGENAAERVEPFPRFLRIVIGVVIHGNSPATATERGHVLARRRFDCMRRRFRPHMTALRTRVDSIRSRK